MRKLLCTAILLFACAAHADKPAELTRIKAAEPYGHATYRALFMNIYDSSLWTDAASWSMEVPFALSNHYRMDFGADEIIDRSISEMKHIEPLDAEKEAHYRALLKPVIPAVKEGDRITVMYLPGKKACFYFNGKPTGTVTDMEFAQTFLGIWLSPKSSDPDFRAKLLAH